MKTVNSGVKWTRWARCFYTPINNLILPLGHEAIQKNLGSSREHGFIWSIWSGKAV